MKLVIDNYSSPFSTEPMYFNTCVQRVGVESVLWNQSQVGVYDMFDTHKPDVFITSIKTISNDIIKYLAQSPKVGVAVNTTDASQGEVDALAKVLQSKNINCLFFFDNSLIKKTPHIIAPTPIKIESIFYGSDLFLTSGQDVPGPQLEAGIIAIGTEVSQGSLDQACEQYNTYHKLVVGEKTAAYDLSVSVVDLVALYPKYESIVLLNRYYSGVCGQIMLDAVLRNGLVETQVMEHEAQGLPQIVDIVGNVGKKYTCFHSSSRLLSKLGLKDESIALVKEANKV